MYTYILECVLMFNSNSQSLYGVLWFQDAEY